MKMYESPRDVRSQFDFLTDGGTTYVFYSAGVAILTRVLAD
jgi:hypothetical protein